MQQASDLMQWLFSLDSAPLRLVVLRRMNIMEVLGNNPDPASSPLDHIRSRHNLWTFVAFHSSSISHEKALKKRNNNWIILSIWSDNVHNLASSWFLLRGQEQPSRMYGSGSFHSISWYKTVLIMLGSFSNHLAIHMHELNPASTYLFYHRTQVFHSCINER